MCHILGPLKVSSCEDCVCCSFGLLAFCSSASSCEDCVWFCIHVSLGLLCSSLLAAWCIASSSSAKFPSTWAMITFTFVITRGN